MEEEKELSLDDRLVIALESIAESFADERLITAAEDIAKSLETIVEALGKPDMFASNDILSTLQEIEASISFMAKGDQP
jgi:hypothetical protein